MGYSRQRLGARPTSTSSDVTARMGNDHKLGRSGRAAEPNLLQQFLRTMFGGLFGQPCVSAAIVQSVSSSEQ